MIVHWYLQATDRHMYNKGLCLLCMGFSKRPTHAASYCRMAAHMLTMLVKQAAWTSSLKGLTDQDSIAQIRPSTRSTREDARQVNKQVQLVAFLVDQPKAAFRTDPPLANVFLIRWRCIFSTWLQYEENP